MLQTLRLGDHLTSRKGEGAGLIFTHIFTSDLQRAARTGQAIADAQLANANPPAPAVAVRQLSVLQEVDFGSREGTSYRSSRSTTTAHGSDWRDRENNESMAVRADRFIDEYLVPAIMDTYFSNKNTKGLAIAVTSHGIFLGVLWMRLLARFWKANVSSAADFSGRKFHWSNTGYIMLDLIPGPPEEGLRGCHCLIEGVNVKTHLQGLEKTGGGVGSAAADGKQRQITEWLSRQP